MKRYGFLIGCIILVCGVMWSNITLAKCPPVKDCKKSLVLAKRADKDKPDCFQLFDCLPAKNCDDCIMRMQWRLVIESKDSTCDETVNLIPDGSILAVDATWHMRRNGPCPSGPIGTVPVGTHEGKFKIITPAGITIATGIMKGTNGLETHGAFPNPECCADRHDEGCLEGIIKTPSGACKLRATYSSFHDSLGTIPVCEEGYWHFWGLLIDGIILCPCPTQTTTTTRTTTTTTTSRTITITIPTTFPTIVQ